MEPQPLVAPHLYTILACALLLSAYRYHIRTAIIHVLLLFAHCSYLRTALIGVSLPSVHCSHLCTLSVCTLHLTAYSRAV